MGRIHLLSHVASIEGDGVKELGARLHCLLYNLYHGIHAHYVQLMDYPSKVFHEVSQGFTLSIFVLNRFVTLRFFLTEHKYLVAKDSDSSWNEATELIRYNRSIHKVEIWCSE